ncbi:hypothetical protein [Pigmentiphaga litoralis]|uniref:hypothetical protein n=1 Tax=Pigmentiphaga litoralis TaxID=516702 RepID=UPI003B431795
MSARPLPPAGSHDEPRAGEPSAQTPGPGAPDEPALHEVTSATFALDTVGDCFVVATGEVRVFAASTTDAIARRPIARIAAGGLLFGVGTSFLATRP